ncbi:hypothetical protein SAMN02746065_11241 [Desulfocicer vacuolatum DSM 3385]|uniref:Uncharacterized protein n=1 Tax=Desulfocicer vacuolatum DSM 3385 TaxID=1121400 RepID=A0A1W2CFF5_9BACT|nr:hypothetical protein [Desulfocicer vacuolatum]SMC83977.1 hypothetical protein SAMN02746065_11241 [Desulfocicer vacuolatum DSM 3385]
MKVFKFLTALMLSLFLAGNAWSDDDIDISAASNAVLCLTQFYSVMAEFPNINMGDTGRMDCKKILIFIISNRDMIIEDIARAKAGYDIARADQIIQNSFYKSATTFGNTTTLPKAMGSVYYDEASKHKYVKINNATYAEYTRKGYFFKNVSSSLPHLVKSQYIHLINEDNFFLYVKKRGGINQYLTLSCKEPHPIGWGLKKVLVPID